MQSDLEERICELRQKYQEDACRISCLERDLDEKKNELDILHEKYITAKEIEIENQEQLSQLKCNNDRLDEQVVILTQRNEEAQMAVEDYKNKITELDSCLAHLVENVESTRHECDELKETEELRNAEIEELKSFEQICKQKISEQEVIMKTKDDEFKKLEEAFTEMKNFNQLKMSELQNSLDKQQCLELQIEVVRNADENLKVRICDLEFELQANGR